MAHPLPTARAFTPAATPEWFYGKRCERWTAGFSGLRRTVYGDPYGAGR
ncbi:hypothetical protein SAMN05421803_10968 [Nocardiopsis flavescens]|uniref:Uncharacterized protein n=1 Tax=Nocardiopsis flavescens TaxID=758803 RepID=A0A1M6LV09_9ACTN|nr:hypothetical protein SAMN05421803_10968 [Nocardiopsis flavescens]